MTVRLGDDEIPPKDAMPIADVTPFHIINGHCQRLVFGIIAM